MAAKAALEPYVGSMAADTCLRATALSAGKTFDDLSHADIGAIEASITRLLAPIAPAPVIDAVLAQIREVAA